VVQQALRSDPFSGDVFVFRAKAADRIKIRAWDGTDQFAQVRRPIPYGTSEPDEGRRFPQSPPGMQRRDRHPEHLENLLTPSSLRRCSVRPSSGSSLLRRDE
jgi:hypothetical protein